MPSIVLANDSKDGQFDGLIVVTDSVDHLPASLQSAQCTIKNYLKVCAVCFLYFFYLFEPKVRDSIKSGWRTV